MYACMYVCVCACICVLCTLPPEWSGRNKVLFTLLVKQYYFPPPKVCGNLLLDFMCVGGGWYINDCARACMHACVWVRVCAGSHIDRKMIWFINYVMMESIKYIILSTCPSVFSVSTNLYSHTYAHHTYIHLCVCVCAWMLSH